MASFSINLTNETAKPTVARHQVSADGMVLKGARFAALQFSSDVSVILPGLNRECVEYLRLLSVALDKAANRMEDELDNQPELVGVA